MKEQLPPYDLDCEESVLGSCLIDSEAIDVISWLKPADFFSEQNQFIYSAMLNLKEGLNQVTVAQELVRMHRLDEAGGVAYLSHLVAIVPTSLHVEYYAKIVHKLSVSRKLISLGNQVTSIGYKTDEPEIALAQLQQLVDRTHSWKIGDELISPNQLFNLGFDLYTERKNGKVKCVSTGIDDFDLEMGGLFSSEVTILASRPGHGKTELAIQIAKHVGKNSKEPVLYGSLEMHWREMLDRMVASEIEVHPRSLRAGHYSDEFYEQITEALPKVTDNNIFLFGKGMRDANLEVTTDVFYRVAQDLKMREGISLLVIDHLGCFGDRYGNSDYSKISYVAQRIKNITVALDIPTLCICQLSRAVESSKNHIPSNKDLRDSGRIEEIVDNILFLFRPDKYPDLLEKEPSLKGQARLIQTKARQVGTDVSYDLLWEENGRKYI